MKIEEKLLFLEIQNGNRKVFEAVFREYYPMLVRFAEGMVFDRQVCEDVVQSLFMHLWEQAGQININTSLKSYLFQSTKNRCLNHLRDLKIHDRHNLLFIESHLNVQDASLWEDPVIIRKISEAIDLLPPQMGNVFRMKYLEQKKYHEIAGTYKISENTVKTQLKRAREKLRRLLRATTSLDFLL